MPVNLYRMAIRGERPKTKKLKQLLQHSQTIFCSLYYCCHVTKLIKVYLTNLIILSTERVLFTQYNSTSLLPLRDGVYRRGGGAANI